MAGFANLSQRRRATVLKELIIPIIVTMLAGLEDGRDWHEQNLSSVSASNLQAWRLVVGWASKLKLQHVPDFGFR